MSYNQHKRFEKIYHEPFYLLDLEKDSKENVVFHISGSTANIYKTTLYTNSRTFFCSCPDARSWAKKQGCVCKHVCFALAKVLKIPTNIINEQYFTNDDLVFSEEMDITISAKIEQLLNRSLQGEDCVNQDFLKKYQELKIIDSDPVAKANVDTEANIKNAKYKITEKVDEVDEDDECMICFDVLDPTKPETLIGCPSCHNSIHKECMEKWLESGKNSCIYCRSDVWKDYGKDISASKTCKGGYKNLLET